MHQLRSVRFHVGGLGGGLQSSSLSNFDLKNHFEISGSNLVNLSALSQPLPPQVVLPTTPLAAPQVQSLKSTAPPPQLIQLRPTGVTSGAGVGQTMQIRPLRAAGGQPGPRPQFFKIVGRGS